VLNGPQGTLFGAGSMSGAVRIVTKKPDPNAFSAGIDLDGGKIDGASHNLSAEGFVNLPIIEGSTALRLSGYSLYQGGFINNLLSNRNWVSGVVSNNSAYAGHDYNVQTIAGGRAAIKQVFSDTWSALLTYGYQSQQHHGAWDEDPTLGSRNVSRFGPESGDNYIKTLDFHLDGDVGIADLVYASTYWSEPSVSTNEYSNYVNYSTVQPYTAANLQSFACQTGPTIQGGTDAYGGCNVPTMYTVYQTQSERWSNELRLESKPGSRVQWLTGLYWEKTRQKYTDFYYMPGIQPSGEAYQSQINYYNNYYSPAAASPLPEEWYSYISRFDYLQTTEFGDLTFNINDQWAAEVGLQHFQSSFRGSSLYAGYFWDPKVPSEYTGASNKWNSKAGVNFKVSKDLLLYASFGQGFRDGGVNSGIGPSCFANGAPAQYKPDTLNNFEIGWKSTDFGGRMTWNGAVYYMPWKNYQTAVYDLSICPTTFNANLGNARIYGAESNVDLKATDHWSLQASVSYNDSHLISNTYDNPNYVVSPGERLPYVPYFNYSANIRYEQPLSADLKGYGQYDIAHKGNMWSDLREVSANGFARSLQPAYEISNLRFGVESAAGHWTAEAYVANLFNTNAAIFTNTGNYDHRETTNEPRVYGLRLSYRFGKGD